jgi:citrate lyase subunit beta/citryl-CoA lyase
VVGVDPHLGVGPGMILDPAGTRIPTGRRACLIVPGSSSRMLEKARSVEADEVVIDLEDAVVPERKAQARAAAVDALSAGGFAAGSVAIRINAPRSPWIADDVAAAATAPLSPSSLVVPKVQSGADLAFVEHLLAEAGAAGAGGSRIGLQALIETARGLWSLREICTSAVRLETLILGYVDLAASLGRSRAAAQNVDLWLPAQERVLVAARAAGLQAIDGPWWAIDDRAGLRAAGTRTAALGFDGKWAIHPDQVSTITTAFTPSADEVARAKAVLDALAKAAAAGTGAVSLAGDMVDEATRVGALRTLARAKTP